MVLPLSFAASLAALDTIRDQLAPYFDISDMPQSGLKWPNDVLIEGGKIAGILLETEEQTLIVGSGINITSVQEKNNGIKSITAIAPVALADVWPKSNAGVAKSSPTC